jgi:hypothetical protein
MPLYLVERTLPYDRDRDLPGLEEMLVSQLDLISPQKTYEGVTWIHSFVTPDSKRSFCLYEGPNPEAVRQVAGFCGLPIDRINEVHFQAPATDTDKEDAPPLSGWSEAAGQAGDPNPSSYEAGE